MIKKLRQNIIFLTSGSKSQSRVAERYRRTFAVSVAARTIHSKYRTEFQHKVSPLRQPAALRIVAPGALPPSRLAVCDDEVGAGSSACGSGISNPTAMEVNE